MKYRELAKTGTKLSSIGLGCMGMSFAYGEPDNVESIATLRNSLELGINFWDTADIYGNGANEELLSQVLKDDRDKVFLATKFGFRQGEKDMYLDGSVEWVKQAVEASLRRLKTDVIDLYYLHRVDPKVPIEETVGAMAELVKEGKVKYIGLSECSAEDLKKAHSIHPITAVQSEYSMITRDVEKEILPLTKELGIAFVPFAPLVRGLITNSLDIDKISDKDFRHTNPRYIGEYRENNENLAKELSELAQSRYGVTASQLALAWVLAQGDNIIPIPGTKRRKYLLENSKAVDIVLNESDLKVIDDLLIKYPNVGARYATRESKFLKK